MIKLKQKYLDTSHNTCTLWNVDATDTKYPFLKNFNKKSAVVSFLKRVEELADDYNIDRNLLVRKFPKLLRG